MTVNTWKSLDVAVLGGGLGGLSAALAMRRQGHNVTIYERYDYAGEVGASLSCASNGGRWLHDWGVDFSKAKPVILKKLIKRKWENGEIISEYPLGDYEQKYGFPYYNLHRIDIHQVLKDYATSEEGEGKPCELLLNHKATKVDYNTGFVEFENGTTITVDLVIAADGIRSLTKPQLGITPVFKSSDSGCIRVLFDTKKVKELGLTDYSNNEAIEYWGETKFKIVLSPCANNEVISCYCFFAAGEGDEKNDWNNDVSLEKLISSCEGLDPVLVELFTKCGYDIKQWRLYVHEPIPYFYKASETGTKGVALLGDAAHAMMPDQSQGAVAAFEDSGALGYIFSKKFNLSIAEGLKIYELERKERVTKIQAASLRARENLNERIGWSSDNIKHEQKLTIDEVCGYDMKAHIDELIAANI
ncbi:FAD-dependent 2-polyprenyl-6-methoxyphenol hydroxylase [Yamadazyma tenuis]|uniref:FAD/NAD(P)-binding domain-containing protein n=1 Tax=Candida tenuis (strain ATCC 10573 / BCRC 21748 / CBS 615 / JCM 9827 / NBRC 10315 / NRRL Y-1498 / VKM Y-70) TaxID=590646 RepID=G3B0W4_CANTC|nr:FAD/NAD(P)-binding domain-containing protein [Yamadazyma tenuis ATCC 10573]EGV64823.1 FAD/NAD(P)-binding domain-containing protein [Yamadazyma tenuis ATCC 10573]WEJ97613.1 FAD-dependent 2-polyprenyl-6-methoxyphenol hydroxylase [Yamadazyma tenuis]